MNISRIFVLGRIQTFLIGKQILLVVLGILLLANTILVFIRTKYNAGTSLMWIASAILILSGIFLGPIVQFTTDGPGRIVKNILLACIALFLALLVFIALVGLSFGLRQRNTDKAYIVLGAGLKGEEVSDLLRRRLEAALRAWTQNPDALIVVTGGQGSREVIPEALAMQRWLLKKGVPEGKILLEDESESTEENLFNAKKLLARRVIFPNMPITIITNTFHCYRASLYARRLGFTRARLLPASMNASTFIQNYFREGLAVIHAWVFYTTYNMPSGSDKERNDHHVDP